MIYIWKEKEKQNKDTQTVFLCKKGTILLRSLFHTLDGLGRALIKGSIEGLNMNLSSFRRNANLWKLAEHCITCRWDTQLLQEEHVLQCSRRSSPSWAGSSRCPTNKDWIHPNAMSSTSPPPRTLDSNNVQFGDVHPCSCTQSLFLSP